MASIRKQRAGRIREEVSLLQVLSHYGYDIDPDNPSPQQFSCDLHGSVDQKPSGRVYPDTNSWYCWGCQKSRDSVETVKDKENVSFPQACRIIEKAFQLPEIDWGSDESFYVKESSDPFSIERPETPEDLQLRVRKLLDAETRDKDLPISTVLSLWEAFDRLSFLMGSKQLPPERSASLFGKLRDKVFYLRGANVAEQ